MVNSGEREKKEKKGEGRDDSFAGGRSDEETDCSFSRPFVSREET